MHRIKSYTLVSSLLISTTLTASASLSPTGFIPPTLDRIMRSRGGGSDEIIVETKNTKRRKKKKEPPTSPRQSDSPPSSSFAATKPKDGKTKIAKTKQLRQQQRSIKSSSESAARNECLRRLKREWKDAVDLGVAYDWSKMKNVKSAKKMTNDENATDAAGDKEYVRIGPFRGNLLRWHFTVTGPTDSAYEGGLYHGRVLLPRNYPGSPPRVQVLTPSGRFQPGADICLTASNFHPESWTPRWTILALVDALRLHMLTPSNEIGGIQATQSQRRAMAMQSRYWKLRTTTTNKAHLRTLVDHERLLPLFFAREEEDRRRERNNTNDEVSDPVPQHARLCTIVRERDFQNMAEKLLAKTRRRNASHQDVVKFFTRTMFVDVLRNPIKVAFLLFVALIAILNSV